jgi:hypothetical protein
MNQAMRASLVMMGNPYAKLSILDDEELAREAATARLAFAKGRHSNSHEVTQPSLFDLQNPYAKLSLLSDEEIALESVDNQERPDLRWKTRTQVYQYVRETFSLSIVLNRPPPLLKQLGEKVIRLSPRAQKELHRRIAAYLPEERIVYNRLSPNELDRLFAKLLEMVDAIATSDGQKD